MRVLIIEPRKEPYEAEINNSLSAMQKVVGGLIQPVDIDENATLICNEEGKLLGLEGNRRVGRDIIAGTFFICGCDRCEGEFISLADEQLQKFHERFKEPEEYTNEEVEETAIVEIYGLDADYEPEM